MWRWTTMRMYIIVFSSYNYLILQLKKALVQNIKLYTMWGLSGDIENEIQYH